MTRKEKKRKERIKGNEEIVYRKVSVKVRYLLTLTQFDVNRSSSIVVKTIKKCPFLRCSKKSMSALPTAECVTVMF